MLSLPISALPNQEFQAILDNNSWNIIIRSTNEVMSVTLALNNTTVIENIRAVAGSLIIPSEYEESGNFFFVTTNQALPNYTQFGISQSLIYVSAAELVTFRSPPASPIITTASFNPIAALPLRFQPSGYVIS